MNDFVGVSMAKKHLKRVYSIIDRDGSGSIDIEEVRKISLLTMRPEDNNENNQSISDNIMAEN